MSYNLDGTLVSQTSTPITNESVMQVNLAGDFQRHELLCEIASR